MVADDEEENEILKSTKCNCCKQDAAKKFVACKSCPSVFHLSCVFRKSGIRTVAKDNYVQCCGWQESGVMSEHEEQIQNLKDIADKDKIIKQLESAQ